MMQIPVFPVHELSTPQRKNPEPARRPRWHDNMLWLVTLAAALLSAPSVAAPAAGDAHVYRVVNGYNRETIGYLRHEFTDATTAKGAVVSVTTDTPSLAQSRTEIYTQDGQWLRRPLDNHGMAIEYEFAPALPAIASPLAAGKSWSTRVNAKVPGVSANRSVRIDGAVLGNERVRVPAGEFDTVKIRRIIYPGDPEFDNTETRIDEIDWYAPALGRSVRSETRSNWMLRNCYRHCDRRGDWHVFELTEINTAPR
jgi:hypothetical protein